MQTTITRNETLLDFAFTQGHRVIYADLQETHSLSIQGASCSIGLDTNLTTPEETVCLAHELGHCETGSFYNRYSQFDLIAKHERHADIWAIKMLIPEDELNKAFECGIVEVWDLAEHFNVTEDFVRKTVEYYKCNRLDLNN